MPNARSEGDTVPVNHEEQHERHQPLPSQGQALLLLLERLTWPRVVLWGVAILIGIGLYFLWEERSTRIPAVLQSNLAIGIIGASAALAAFSAVGSNLFRRVEVKNAELLTFMREQISDMRQMMARQAFELRASEAREAQLERDVDALRRRLTRAEDIIRSNGLDFKETRP